MENDWTDELIDRSGVADGRIDSETDREMNKHTNS